MNVHFTFRNIAATEALKNHVDKKVAKFTKYVTYPMEVHVILSAEKTFQRAEITCHAEHREIVADDRSKDLYESIDNAVQKIETQLKKEREKKKGHTAGHKVARPSTAARLAQDVGADVPHRSKKVG